jgi:hypothetical protein
MGHGAARATTFPISMLSMYRETARGDNTVIVTDKLPQSAYLFRCSR